MTNFGDEPDINSPAAVLTRSIQPHRVAYVHSRPNNVHLRPPRALQPLQSSAITTASADFARFHASYGDGIASSHLQSVLAHAA